jgi:hypothetical protein
MRGNVRSLVALLLAVALLVYPATVLANDTGGTAAEGTAAGQADGRTDTSSRLWRGVGCLLGPLGVATAYFTIPNPSPTRLLGKSPEYVAAYSDAYRAAAKRAQANNAWTGFAICLVSVGVGAGITYIIVVSAIDYANENCSCQPIGGYW